MLNIDSRSKSKLHWIGTLLIPAIAVQAVRFMVGGSGPAAASAAATPAAPQPAPIAAAPEDATPLSPARARAVEWLRTRKQTLGVRSPMDHADTMPEPTITQAPAPVLPQPLPAPQLQRPPSSMSITAIMADGAGGSPIVSINHKLFHVGDEIVPQWRITEIDAHNRTVSITGPEGQSMTLSLANPEN